MANEYENTTFAEEFAEGVEGMDPNMELPQEATEAPAEKSAKKETYTMNDGSQGSRAAFIREKFLTDNLSRKQISEQFGFPYRVVYSATVNLANAAEATTRGRTATNSVIHLTEDGKVVIQKDGKILIDGEETDEVVDFEALKTVNRNEWIREQAEAGMSRGDIAKKLDMSYGVVYSMTKEMEGSRSRVEIELEDGTKIGRADYIRQLFEGGMSRGDIAKKLDVPYSVVWQATKTEKTAADKLKELADELKKFHDKVTDPDLLSQIVEAIGTLEIKADEESDKVTEEAANVEE
jgi:transposase